MYTCLVQPGSSIDRQPSIEGTGYLALVSALSTTCCVALSKFLDLSVPYFPDSFVPNLMVSLKVSQRGHTRVAVFSVMEEKMKDKSKQIVLRGMPSLASCGRSAIWRNPLKDHLQSFLASSCTCGEEVSLTGRRDRACSAQPLLF